MIQLVIKGVDPAVVSLSIDQVAVPPSEIPEPRRVDPGTHRIVVEAPGFEPVRRSVAVFEGAKTRILEVILSPHRVEKPEKPATMADSAHGWRGIAGLSAVGVSVAFVGAGLVSTLQVSSVQNDDAFVEYRRRHPESRDVCADAESGSSPQDARVSDLCSKGSTFEVLQLVFYGAAAVSMGAGIYLLATNPSGRAPASALTLSPRVGPRAASATATYSF